MSSSEENISKTIDDLPDEILEYILSLVSPYKDSESCKEVCKRWCRAINNVNNHSKYDLYRSVLNSNVLWHSIAPPNFGSPTTITRRYSHSACYCDNFMYVFGGCTLRCTMFNDLWTLDLNKRTWVRPYSSGCYPSPKACATLCQYKKSLVLFGGWTHPAPYPLHQTQRLFNELHIFDIKSNAWTIIHSAEMPPPMAGHSATIHGKKMVVFGGLQYDLALFLYSSSNDVWCFDLEARFWFKAATTQEKPRMRYGQSQIYLDDENLLIMGGCHGPNVILDDVWILTITKTIWVWKKVKVNNSQWAAPLMWCHPACKVGDLVVVFSCSPSQSLSHYPSCSPVRTSPPPTQDAAIPPEVLARQASQGPVTDDKDVNVNGQRGSLGKNKPANEAGTSSSSGYRVDGDCCPQRTVDMRKCRCYRARRLNGEIQLAAFQSDVPFNCHTNTKNRLRQLELLKKMEERYKNPPKEDKPKPDKGNDPGEPGPSGNGSTGNRLNMYVMDISQALAEDSSVTWKQPTTSWNAPADTVFHSLVLGKGELIIFGGVQKNSASAIPVAGYKAVSNTTHIITAPKNVV